VLHDGVAYEQTQGQDQGHGGLELSIAAN